MSEKDGGPAFPGKSMGFVGIGPFGEATAQYGETPGMTLRDFFAATASIEIDVPIDTAVAIVGEPCPPWQTDMIGNLRFWAKAEAIIRGIKADAMLAERAKE